MCYWITCYEGFPVGKLHAFSHYSNNMNAFMCYPWHNNICDIIICTTCIYFAE